MEELAHRFLVAAHQRRDLGAPFATSAGQHHLAATHLYAIRRAQTGSQGRALLVGERTDKDGRSHTSQDTPFRPTFTEIALGGAPSGIHRAVPYCPSLHAGSIRAQLQQAMATAPSGERSPGRDMSARLGGTIVRLGDVYCERNRA